MTISGSLTGASATSPGADTYSVALRSGTTLVVVKSTGLILQGVQPIGAGFTQNYNYIDLDTGLAGSLAIPSVLTDSDTVGSVIIQNSSAPGNGNGTIVFLQDQQYSGGTTVKSGATLQLGNGGTSGSVLGNVLNDGALVFDRSDAVTFGGTVSGGGGLTQAGSGTLILTGANTYTGGTTISGGTLQLGNGGTTGSILGDVVDNGTLAFNHADDVTFAGVISGTGGLVQAGPGALSLTGANTYTGGTLVFGGTLVGNTTSLQGNIVDNASVVFNQAATGTYAGVISGSGSLTKTGRAR